MIAHVVLGASDPENQAIRMTTTISFQPELRPELPLVDGPKEYHEQRALFIRLDELLDLSNVEHRFFELSAAHQAQKQLSPGIAQ